MLQAELLRARILKAWPEASVSFIDTTGTGDHFQATVIAGVFEGKMPVEQHKMVYALFDEELKSGELHALALKTFTPAQWQRKQAQG